MADLSVRVLKLRDNEQEPLPGTNPSISEQLTKRWFGEEVLKEMEEGLEMRGYVQGMKVTSRFVLLKRQACAELTLC